MSLHNGTGTKLPVDQFEILREVGRGGSSVVYLVRDKESGRQFAMKTVKLDSAAAELLQAEAQTLAELNSASGAAPEGIPAYYGEVYNADGFAGFLMEYVEGESLQKILEEGRIFTVREAAEAGVGLCGILTRLHEMDPPRIYRDMKPGNVLVREDGRYVLVDYGAVRAFKTGAARDTHPLGTEGYAAPEQYGGWEQSDARTDVYGVGALLHHMLTGRPPIETGLRPLAEIRSGAADYAALPRGGRTEGYLRGEGAKGYPRSRRTEGYPRGEGTKEYAEMDRILRRSCSIAPSMRYRNCAELAKALRRLCHGSADTTRAWKMFVVLTAASLALVVGAGIWGTAASGAEMRRYHRGICEARAAESQEDKIELFRQTSKIRKFDPEAYLALLAELAADGVLTKEEKERFEGILYENGYPQEMKRRSKAAYALLEMEMGKVYLACCEGGEEAAGRAFANAAAGRASGRRRADPAAGTGSAGRRFAAGPGSGTADRRFAEAMCAVLSDDWSTDRIGAWEVIVTEAAAEAMRTGDGTFAATVCSRAAGEFALFADRFREAGADTAQVRQILDEVKKLAQAAESGRIAMPQRHAEDLLAAARAAERVYGEE